MDLNQLAKVGVEAMVFDELDDGRRPQRVGAHLQRLRVGRRVLVRSLRRLNAPHDEIEDAAEDDLASWILVDEDGRELERIARHDEFAARTQRAQHERGGAEGKLTGLIEHNQVGDELALFAELPELERCAEENLYATRYRRVGLVAVGDVYGVDAVDPCVVEIWNRSLMLSEQAKLAEYGLDRGVGCGDQGRGVTPYVLSADTRTTEQWDVASSPRHSMRRRIESATV